MTLPSRQTRARTDRGFTLIEVIAVIAIFSMIVAIGIPRLSSSKWRALRDEAESIASSLDYARQRAVMTGIPHRLLIDLEDGGYRIEWWVTEDKAFESVRDDGGGGDFDPALFAALDEQGGDAYGGNTKVDRHPPVRNERDYYPIPNRQLGSFTWLDDALYFVGVESSEGWVEGGDIQIVFDVDGTTDFTLLELADADDNHMTLEIEPLLDRVRRRQGSARS